MFLWYGQLSQYFFCGSSQKEKNRIYELASAVLLLLTLGALAYYRTTDAFIHDTGDSLFFNGAFFVTTFVSIAYYVVAVIMQFNKELFSDTKRLIAYTPCNAIAYALGFSILFLAFRDNFHFHLEQPISEYASLLTANINALRRSTYPAQTLRNK